MRLCLNDDKCYILSKWAYSERYYDMHGRIQILWRRRQTSHQMLPRTFSAPAPAQLAQIVTVINTQYALTHYKALYLINVHLKVVFT